MYVSMHTSTCVTSKDNAKSNDSDRIFVIRENMRLKHRCPYDSNNSHSPFLQCALLIYTAVSPVSILTRETLQSWLSNYILRFSTSDTGKFSLLQS